jgi:hypothetical protein
MLEHIERLKAWQALDLPAGIERQVHQNRLLKIAREGGQMTPADLAKFEPQRRYATLVALAIEGMATVTDEIIDLHDRILGKLFNAAKNKHQQQFQASGKAINDKVRMYGRIGQALIEAKQSGGDPFAAIEAVMPWDAFAASVTEAQSSRSRRLRFPAPHRRELRHLAPLRAAVPGRAQAAGRAQPPRACSMPSRCCAA